MRENNLPASSSAASFNGEAASASQPHFSSSFPSLSNPHPHATTTLMSQYGPTPWSALASSSAELTGAMHSDDHDHDHDMADVDLEDGGVALTETYTHNSVAISSFAGDTNDADDLDDTNPLDLSTQYSPMALLNPTIDDTMPHIPPPTVIPDPMFQPFTQLPAFAQQVLSNIPPQAQSQFQQQLLNDLEDELGDLHGALPLSNPNHLTLGPDNFSLVDFLRSWARLGRSRDGHIVPGIEGINALIGEKGTNRTHFGQLRGDERDFQGLDWTKVGVPRSSARDRRRATYKNYVNKVGSDKWHTGLPDQYAVPRDNYFRFRSMDIRRDTRLLHFQLRNILACASRTRAFFPSFNAIRELDPTSGRTRKAMDFGPHGDVQVSTLAASHETLVAGSFLGDYRYRNINSESREFTEGKLTEHVSGITNHVQIHSARRSSAPIAAFASNDFGFRTVDLTTNQLLFERMYNYPLNCSAISTDQRLRVMVGDDTNVLITDAETGEILKDLSGHRDFGFACDWAPDGWTVATGFQDKSVRIWDARRWTNTHTGEGAPLAVLRCDMSGARSLRFSPLGSGKRVLVAAEEADIISIYDAQTFDTQQKIDMFGEIGGTAFADDGQVLMALNTDPTRGGIVQFDKCDGGAEDSFNTVEWDIGSRRRPLRRPVRCNLRYDWQGNTSNVLGRLESLETMTERKRKAGVYHNMDPF